VCGVCVCVCVWCVCVWVCGVFVCVVGVWCVCVWCVCVCDQNRLRYTVSELLHNKYERTSNTIKTRN